jgi:hypothetical protein
MLLLLWRLTSEASWPSAFSCVILLQCIKSVQLPFLFTGFGSLCSRREAPTRGSGPAGRCHIVSQQPHKRAGILVMAPMAFILSLIFPTGVGLFDQRRRPVKSHTNERVLVQQGSPTQSNSCFVHGHSCAIQTSISINVSLRHRSRLCQ